MTAYPKPVKRARRPSTMPRKLVDAVIARDGRVCVISGPDCTGVARLAHHRANRQMGGAAVLNNAANLTGACSPCNGFVEDSHGFDREELVRRGLRVIPDSTHQRSLARSIATPVCYPDGRWWFLREDGGRDETTEPREEEEQHGDEV